MVFNNAYNDRMKSDSVCGGWLTTLPDYVICCVVQTIKKKKLRKGQNNNNNNTSSNERSESHLLITNQVEILPNFIAYTS